MTPTPEDDTSTSTLGAVLAMAGSTMLLGAMALGVTVARWRTRGHAGGISLVPAAALAVSVMAAAIGKRGATWLAMGAGALYVASAITAGTMAAVHAVLACVGVIAMASGARGARAYWLYVGVTGGVLMGAGVWR